MEKSTHPSPEAAFPLSDGDDSRDRVTVLLITASAVALGLYRLDHVGLWFDEGLTVAVAGTPVTELFDVLKVSGGNMALYQVLMWPWARLVETEWALRLPSILFAAATVPTLYALARRLAGRRAALLAAAFFALSGTFVKYAQEARSYTLTMLLLTLSWLALARAAEQPSRGRWLMWFVSASAALYGHLIAGPFLAVQVLSLAFLPPGTVRRRDVVPGVIVGAILLLPLATLLLSPESRAPDWIAPLSVDQVLAAAGVATGALHERPHLAVVLAILVVAGREALRTFHEKGRSFETWRAAAPFAWVVVPFALATAISLANPLMVARFYSPALPGTAIAIGAVIAHQRWVRPGLLALPLLVLVLPAVADPYRRLGHEDWRGAAKFVVANAERDQGIAFFTHEGRSTFEYYVMRHNAEKVAPRPLYPLGVWDRPRRDYPLPRLPAFLETLARHDEVWVLEDIRARLQEDVWERAEATRARLGRTHRLTTDEWFSGAIHVLLYEKESIGARDRSGSQRRA